MQPLDPEAVSRLCKLLGMLGSAYAGERAAAGAKAHEFIKQRGLTWSDVITPVPVVRPQPQYQRTQQPRWRIMAHACWLQSYRLNEREREFVDNIRFWNGTPSEKQLAWLTRIYENLA
jgi:hypothetical protein